MPKHANPQRKVKPAGEHRADGKKHEDKYSDKKDPNPRQGFDDISHQIADRHGNVPLSEIHRLQRKWSALYKLAATQNGVGLIGTRY